jgi:Heterokaryon incompatibility protein (HET)
MKTLHGTRTRLVDISTIGLQEFPISSTPAHLGISHVWSERLFATTYLNKASTSLIFVIGMEMLRLLKQRPRLPRVQYCWVDTWCIDQNDAEDKARQI